MASAKDALRTQRRRELDARRSRSRVRLGSSLQGWGKLKDQLGFSLHSQMAQFLLQSYFSKECSRCSGGVPGAVRATVSTTDASLNQLVLLVHSHGQHCPLPPTRAGQGAGLQVGGACRKGRRWRQADTDPEAPAQASEAEVRLRYVCERGHGFTWCPAEAEQEPGREAGGGQRQVEQGNKRSREQRRGRRRRAVKAVATSTEKEGTHDVVPQCSAGKEGTERPKQDVALQEEGSGVVVTVLPLKNRSLIVDTEDCEDIGDEKQSPDDSRNTSAVPVPTKRGRHRRTDQPEKPKGDHLRTVRRQNNRQQPVKDDTSQISGRRKRKATPKLILPCEFEGCWKIFSSRQYLNHHMKYQHVHQKTFSCSHPSCGKSFNFKKHLKEHEKLHSDRRDYICEFCARAFRTSSNLSIHRRIHTGEKPLQCEVCGFTCRQKASLNWHMRKHNAERNYHFPCNVCGRRFEKRDNVTAHRSKSHPELPAPCTDTPRPLSLTPELPAPCTDMPRPLSPSPELPAPHHLAPAQLPPSAPGTGWKRSKPCCQ
ncbi:zinc finger protein 692 isoform X1 [Electrophorus electricus]|uniref:zinc finger protein 692 isoform X1 n=1 Tax=Electrophorus electricus TaxID=8005 RepID=UPI0015D06011|nr:zinc finger protein 692 isoform X1 [Electrophorus electricus]XP_035377682.1 zinc finger protein 692 isoform X1 [Electrophorus electricus]